MSPGPVFYVIDAATGRPVDRQLRELDDATATAALLDVETGCPDRFWLAQAAVCIGGSSNPQPAEEG